MLNDMLEFDGFLVLSVAAEAPEEQQDWRIENDAAADWAIEKIKFYRAELERKRQLAEEKKKQIDAWLKSEQEKAERQIAFFEQKLYEYFMSLDPSLLQKSKTQVKYELFSGTLKLKKQNLTIERDNETLLKWLEQSGLTDYIKIKKEPNWIELKKNMEISGNRAVYKNTGEVIPGIKVELQPDKFIVE
jgi:phage host-nuclease inhibitor protein Gam